MNRFLSLPLLAMLFPLILPAQEWESIGPYGGTFFPMVHDSVIGSTLAVSNGWLWRHSGSEAEEWEPLVNLRDSPYGAPALLYSAGDGTYMRVGSDDLYFSDNGGTSWTLQGYLTIHSLGAEPEIVVLDDTLYMSDDRSILSMSSDRGVTWNRLDTIPLERPRLTSDGREIYATSTLGLYHYWKREEWRLIGPAGGYRPTLITKGDTLLYGGSGLALHRSYDHGMVWETVPGPLPVNMVRHERTIWMLAADGLYTMPIDGNEWTLRAAISGRPFGTTSLVMHAGNLLIGDLYDIQRLDDETATLNPFMSGLNAVVVRQIMNAGDTILVRAEYGGLHYTDDNGTTWRMRAVPAHLGLEPMQRVGGVIYGIKQGSDSLYVTEDWAESWAVREIDPDSVFGARKLFATADVQLVAGESLRRSSDRGRTWSRSTLRPAGPIGTIAGEGDTIIISVTTSPTRFYRSYDRGITWDSTTTDLSVANTSRFLYTRGILYHGSPLKGLHRSLDQGTTWEAVDSTISVSTFDVQGDTILAAFNRRQIVLSTDAGAAWKELSLPEQITSVTALHLDNGRVLVGSGTRSVFATMSELAVPHLSEAKSREIDLGFDHRSGLLHWSASDRVPYRLDLYTLTGEHVTLIADGEAAAGTHALPLDDLPAGAYLCTVRTEEGAAGIIIMSE